MLQNFLSLEGGWQGRREYGREAKVIKQTSTLADKLKTNNKIFLPLNSSGAMAEMNHKWLVCTGLPHLQICFFPFLFGSIVRSGDGVLLERPLEHY